MDRDATIRRRPSIRRAFLQLERTPSGARRMDERDSRAMRARARRVVDEPYAARFQLRERRRQVVDGKGDVMQPFAPPLDRPRERANPAPSARAARSTASPTGTNTARTRSVGTSAGSETSRPSASR